MKYRKFGDTLVVRVDRGDGLVASIREACENARVKYGSVTGIGAVDHAVLGLYKVAEQKYDSNAFDGEMELTSLIGNISEKDGQIYLHFHATLAKADGTVLGGHLNEAVVSGTGEIFIRILYPALGHNLNRKFDPETGLNILDL